MLIASAGRRVARWVPAMRCAGVALALLLGMLGAARGTWASLWFFGASIGLAVAAGAVWRRVDRVDDTVTVRAPLRSERTLDVTRMTIRLDRSGYGRTTTLSIGPGIDEVAAPVAVFTPSSHGQIVRTSRRLARTLGLEFDEDSWAPWLAGRTLRAPRPRRRR